jgi:hypothetical protein
MCGGGGHPQGGQHPIIVRGGFRGWTPGTGPGRGKITGRHATPTPRSILMCIMTSGGSSEGPSNWGHPHSRAHRHYGRQARKGGWMFDRAGALLARLGAHPLGEVIAGRMRASDWLRFQFDLQAHAPDCRYRRLLEAVRP